MKINKSSSSKSIIAVDIDDVIAAHAIGFVEYSNKKFGTNLTIDDYQDHWGEIWKTEHKETERRAVEYHESGHIATYGTIEGAYKVLKELKERFTLVVLTTRRNSINQLTKEWISKYYPDIFDEFIFSGFFDSPTKESIHMTKGELAKQIGASYLIDDQLKHVQSAAELGIKGLLFGEYSWNKVKKLPLDVTRVKNWEEVRRYFANSEGESESTLEDKLRKRGDPLTAAIAVVERNGEILTGFRNYTKDKWKDISVWTIPGGRCEENETLEEALRREVIEEVNITDLKIIDFIGQAPGAKEGDTVVIFYCVTDQDAKLMEPEKFSEWRWITKDEYLNDKQYSGFNPAARKLITDFLNSKT